MKHPGFFWRRACFHDGNFFLVSGGLGVATLAIGLLPKFSTGTALISEASAAEAFEVTHSDSEWHAILSDEQYDILREEGTERAYSSPLNNEHGDGTFVCAGCELPLFSSATKFDSRTGWPSFWAPWTRPWRPARTERSAWSAKRFIAGAAAGIWGMSLTMARNPLACVTA